MEDKINRSDEIANMTRKLIYQDKEKKKSAQKLDNANNELNFQREEKEKLTKEIVIANTELSFQKEEKDKRAEELIIVNKELAYQVEEKEKKAAELVETKQELNKSDQNLTECADGLEEIAFMTSHRVRQPLANILGISNILDDESEISHKESIKLVGFIKKSVLSLNAFTKDLMTFIIQLRKKFRI